MIAAVPLALAVSLAPSASSEIPDLVEVATTRFAPSLEGLWAGYRSLAAHPDLPYAYARSLDTLFVLDTARGQVVATRSLVDIHGADARLPGSLEVAGSGSSALLVAGPPYGQDEIEIFSLADPREPALVASIPAGAYADWRILPDGRSLALVADSGAGLWDLATGTKLAEFERSVGPSFFETVIGAGGPADDATVALIEVRAIGGQEIRALVLYDVVPGSPPVIRTWADLPARPIDLLVDARGEIVVAKYDGGSRSPITYEVRDARTAEPLSTIHSRPGAWVAALAEGGGARILALAAADGLDLHDLADPSFPIPLTSVESRLGFDYNGYLDSSGALAAARSAPLLFVASPGERAVLEIDLRDGSIVGRASTAGLPPVSVVLGESPGRRDAVVLAYRMEFDEVLDPGGRRELQVHDLAEPAAPALVARISRSEPSEVDGFVAIGPDLAVAVESSVDAYALVSLREGRVVQVTGPPRRVGPPDTFGDSAWLRAAGRFLLAVGSYGWQEWALVSGRLEPVAGGGVPYREGYAAGEVHRGGRVVLLGHDRNGPFLEVHDPDGRGGRLRLDAGADAPLALSPDGKLATLTTVGFEPGEGGLTCFDLGDPEHPRIAWQGVPGVATARFDPSGASILVTLGYFGGSFVVRRVDARTGAFQTEASAPIEKFYYHGEGTAYGSGSAWRAVFWRWTWLGSETVLLDAAATPPKLLRIYPEVVDAFQAYAPRGTGGWYEILRNPWERFSDFLVADAEGAQRHVLHDPRDHDLPAPLARGYLATVANRWGPHPEVVLWHDTTLRRPDSAPFPGAPLERPVATR